MNLEQRIADLQNTGEFSPGEIETQEGNLNFFTTWETDILYFTDQELYYLDPETTETLREYYNHETEKGVYIKL